jgi:hypothetical protein
MSERDQIIGICEALALPKDQYAVCGSGVMVMHGIERDQPMGDLDIFCTTGLWFHLYESIEGGLTWGLYLPDPYDEESRCDPPYLFLELMGLEVNLFHSWRQRERGNIDVNAMIRGATEIEGIPVAQLELLYRWKNEVMRAKDEPDMRAIERYFKDQS